MHDRAADIKPRLAWYEDNQDVIEPVKQKLRQFFQVAVFNPNMIPEYDSEEALLNKLIRLIREYDPHFLLLDCYMDHVSGIELYRQLGADIRSIPVAFFTLWAKDESTRREIEQLGVSVELIIYKDITAKSLAKALHALYVSTEETSNEG